MLHESRQRGALAEILVAYRFVEAGYLISYPVIPCSYDLVVDAGAGLLRVQVKQAHQVGDMPGHYNVSLASPRWTSAGQKVRLKAVTGIDLLCVVTTPDETYVIPAGAAASHTDPRWLQPKLHLGPQTKYRIFLNRFQVGPGVSEETTVTQIHTLSMPASQAWAKQRAVRGVLGTRKKHCRLPTDVANELLELPIRWYKKQPGEGLIDHQIVAEQLGVTVTTLRNLILKRGRKDLALPDESLR
jgi:hypothetical protein